MYILFLQFTHSTTVRFLHDFECKGNLIHPKTEQDLNKFYIIKLDYSIVAHEEAKTQVASLQKELFEIAQLKTLTTKSTKSHIFLSLILN